MYSIYTYIYIPYTCKDVKMTIHDNPIVPLFLRISCGAPDLSFWISIEATGSLNTARCKRPRSTSGVSQMSVSIVSLPTSGACRGACIETIAAEAWPCANLPIWFLVLSQKWQRKERMTQGPNIGWEWLDLRALSLPRTCTPGQQYHPVSYHRIIVDMSWLDPQQIEHLYMASRFIKHFATPNILWLGLQFPGHPGDPGRSVKLNFQEEMRWMRFAATLLAVGIPGRESFGWVASFNSSRTTDHRPWICQVCAYMFPWEGFG